MAELCKKVSSHLILCFQLLVQDRHECLFISEIGKVSHISLENEFFYKRISNDLNISIYLAIIRTQNRMNRRILCESMSGDVFG